MAPPALQVAEILRPDRRGGDIAAGIFGQDGMAVLHAGDIEAAVAAVAVAATLSAPLVPNCFSASSLPLESNLAR